MTTRDLLERAATEGVSVSLKLRLDGERPSPETLELLTFHKETLLDGLAGQRVGGLDFPPVLMHSLLVWIGRYHPLSVTTPEGTNADATPEEALGALTRAVWCCVSDAEGYRLISKGNVPTEVRGNLRELDTRSMFAQPKSAERLAVVN